ncbi:malto-oligosyltrehalose trehalohydrolase [Intrasporangium mesophilum]
MTSQIRVWAPAAERVDIAWSAADPDPGTGIAASETQATRTPASPVTTTPMARGDDGWWTWWPEALGALDYAFRLDGGDPRPDPRSPWLPDGVHGATRTFDASGHAWQDAGWRGARDRRGLLGGVVYELHVGTFTHAGTLDAAVEHLEHLVRLGVDVVEVMPVGAFGGTHGWGYDGVQPYAVHQPYGGPAAFQRFVDACHRVGLAVCLDVVYNHLGATGNYLAEFGPYFTDRYSTPWGPAVNLDGPGSAVVRRWVVDNALRWFRDFHVDALRLDAVHAFHDESDRHILAQLSDETALLAAELGRPLDLVAESDLNDPIVVAPTAQGGRGMTAQWDDDIHHALHVVLTGETQGYYADFAGGTAAWPSGGPLSVLAKTLSEVFLHDGRMSTFRKQSWGAAVDRSSTLGQRFLAYLQTHDQVGNRARGDRINHTVDEGLQAIGAAIYLLSPYTAMLFMGEEWRASTPFAYFTSFDEDWLAEAVRRGRRAEFAAHGWAEQDVPDPQDPSTRDESVLRWDEVDGPGHRGTLEFYRRLIELRRTEPDVADGDLSTIATRFDEAARWFVMTRGSVQVVANLAAEAQVVPVQGGVGEVLASWGPAPNRVAGGLWLAAHDVAIVRTP